MGNGPALDQIEVYKKNGVMNLTVYFNSMEFFYTPLLDGMLIHLRDTPSIRFARILNN